MSPAAEEKPQNDNPQSSLSQIFRHSMTAPSRSYLVLSFFTRTSDEPSNTTTAIRQSFSVPSEVLGLQETKRSPSSGFLFSRKKSKEQKELVSRARAQELCLLYELNEENPSLHKMLQRRTGKVGTPQFAMKMSAKQAAETFAKNEKERLEKKAADLLITERQRRQVKQALEIKRRKATINSLISPASQLSLAPSLSWQEPKRSTKSDDSSISTTIKNAATSDFTKPQSLQKQEMALAQALQQSLISSKRDLTMKKKSLSKSMGTETVPLPLSPGSYSVAPTEPNTPSPKQEGGGGFITSVWYYDLPSLC